MELAVDLSRAPDRLREAAGDLFKNEADALKRDMQRDAMNHRYLPKFARQLNQQKLAPMDHVIGFHTRGQGSLAHIIVFGSVNNAPVYNFYGPLQRRTPFFVEHLARVAEDSVFGDPGKS
jgi:hypothetical protein